MKTFIEKIVNEIIKEDVSKFSNMCIVFPSRRACIYFKKILASKLEDPIWSPDVLGIQDMVEKLSPYRIPDNLILIFELFDIYKRIEKNARFDDFYPWGEMLLTDFDTIDKYLVDTDNLFTNVKNLRSIDDEFPTELPEDFKKFWGSIFNIDNEFEISEAKEEFIKLWEVMGEMYNSFRKTLQEKNIAYEGMAYRRIYEDIKKGVFNPVWDKVIFAGFNALTRCEEEIISELIIRKKAVLYWDADNYYVIDTKQESGKFIRQNFKNLNIKSPEWIENNLLTDKKSISFVGASLQEGMVKALGNELSEFLKSDSIEFEKTAIILSDENLLLPVLYSIPEQIKEFNVTMGLPFKNTPLYNLIRLIISLQENKIVNNDKVFFYHNDVEQLLMHPYIKFHNPSYVFKKTEEIKYFNLVFVSEEEILFDRSNDSKHSTPEILKVVFKNVKDYNGVYNYFENIINIISDRIEQNSSNEPAYEKFQLEYIFNFYTNLNKLNEVLIKYAAEINLKTYWNLLKEILSNVKIPFTGEPEKGLQIMGLLETRALDFDNIFMISMNEGMIPKGNTHNSFIPYTLRKAFRMPTYEDNDAISGYYFYRLLQKAKNVFLFYDAKVGEFVKEKSRFLLQTGNELTKSNKQIIFSQKLVSPDLNFTKVNDISIKKSKEVLKELETMEFSASSLNKFINCPLDFYFSKVANLKEDDIVEEIFSASMIGTIIHALMKNLYLKYKGKTISVEIIENLIEKLNEDYDKFFNQVISSIPRLSKFNINLSGRNLLLKSIIRKLVERVLINEIKEIPFKILGHEIDINSKLNIGSNGKDLQIIVKGRIDRIDEKDNLIRILDYKTGQTHFKPITKKNEAIYFDELFSDPDFKDSFQACLYGYLYSREFKKENISVGLYPLKKLGKEGIKMIKDNNSHLNKDELDSFEDGLKKLLQRIFNPDEDFTQTENEDNCKYCSFSSICYRETKDW